MRVKLIQLKSKSNTLRTKEIEGYCESFPVYGESFVMYGEPLKKEFKVRLIVTTPVRMLERKYTKKTKKYSYIFDTENSTYKLEILEGEVREKIDG